MGLLIFTAVTCGVCLFLMQVMKTGAVPLLRFDAAQDPTLSPLAVHESERRFPTPRLQEFPVQDLAQFRRQEGEHLQGYGWVDPAAGKVHIPVEAAMVILAQRGLPSRTAGAPLLAPSPAASSLTAPTLTAPSPAAPPVPAVPVTSGPKPAPAEPAPGGHR